MTARLHPMLPRTAVQANGLLAVMPNDALDRLLPAFEKVRLIAGDVLYDENATLKFAYFPADAIVTFMLQTREGTAAQVAVAGREGMVGISVLLGGKAYGRALVLNTGDAFRISAATLKTEFDRNGPVMRLLLRYIQTVVTHMAQTAVCNRHHRLEQQLCGWLLACMDRLPHGNHLKVTHETIAHLLGVRREGISEAAVTLRLFGLIAYTRGHIRLLDRAGLQARACECYQVVKRETDRLLPDRPAT